MPRGRPGIWITLLFVCLAAVMTWPQARVFATHAPDHQDVFFNLWRLRWIAHALGTSPADLFHGNIFHPEHNVLAFSDAMLVEGILAAPLLWAGVPPVLVHNLVLLGGVVASAVGIALLARQLTGSTPASVVAGVVFAFAPYRFDHYYHMELQWTVWTPWAFWALHRTLQSGSIRDGALTGACIALQMASSIYYGIFLSVVIAAVAVVRLLVQQRVERIRSLRSLAVGAAIAVAASAVYLLPYATAAQRVGTRTPHDVTTFSARPRDYANATPSNMLYGTERGRAERRLFPGILAPLLALVGLLLVTPTPSTIAFVLGLTLAFELSLGAYGVLYPLLYEHIPVFRALRAPARAAVFVLFFLGLLAAEGTAALTSLLARRTRIAFAGCVVAVLLLEYWVAPLHLVRYPNSSPPLYSFLARLPPGVVAEFPMPRPKAPPHHDARYAYMSTFHWKPLVNGYSGFYPPSYLVRLEDMAWFPDERSIAILRRSGVKYVVVHDDGYKPGEYQRIVIRLSQLGLSRLGEFENGWNLGTVMQLL